jgi:serine/threonine-protein kinase RsbW
MAANEPAFRQFDHDKLLLKLRVTMAADPHAVMPVVEGIMEVVRNTNCANGKEYQIELALNEALANAVVHGCKKDPTKLVECCVMADGHQGMLIIVRDPGPGFDPANIPNPVMGENVFANHGRGIFLINQLMDEVRFERGGTEIHMRKKLSE